jgi:hypothetical protein
MALVENIYSMSNRDVPISLWPEVRYALKVLPKMANVLTGFGLMIIANQERYRPIFAEEVR